MSLLQGLPDWRKIGKKIGKKLRDILNPPPPGLSKEERLEQRLRESLKGLVYFDTFDEIEQWTLEDVDPISQANTPLLHRSASRVNGESEPSARILLCHDYSGLLSFI